MVEHLSLSKKRLKGEVVCYTGRQGKYWVSYIPSLEVVGYSNTKHGALEDLGYNFHVFAIDFFKLSVSERKRELEKLGWTQTKYKNKQFSKSKVGLPDDNFDIDSPIYKSVYKAA